MIRFQKCITIIILIIAFNSTAQNWFPNAFEGCNTERFALEGDSLTAKVDKTRLIALMTNAIDSTTLAKMRGIIKLQVIAYMDNSSCTLSYENTTNVSDDAINFNAIKEMFDSQLLWDSVREAASPMIEFYFLPETITVRRMGFNGKKVLHELRE